MQDIKAIKDHAVEAMEVFDIFRGHVEGMDEPMSIELQADLAAWFAQAGSTGPLDLTTVEEARELVARLDDEVAALGGPYETYGQGDEIFITSGTYDGDRLAPVARAGRRYLCHACRVIYALEAKRAIARIRETLDLS